MIRLPKHVTVVEVGPRDGFQIERMFVPTDVKVEIIDALIGAGIRQMQVTSFVSPKAVPALADADEVFRRIRRPKGVVLTALAANMKGAELAIAAKVDVLDLVVSASETHNRKNVNRSVDESLKGFTEIAKVCAGAGIPIKGGIATALGCPFEGEVPTSQIVRIAKHYRDLGSTTVSLGDTTGMATPPIVRAAVRALKAEVPELEIVLHLHNTRGLGLVNAMTGLEEGVTKLDGAIAGLGGCPFAAGATGNVCTEDLIFMLHECGIETGIDLRKLIAVAKRVEQVFGRELPGQLMKSGLRLDLHDMKAVPTAAG